MKETSGRRGIDAGLGRKGPAADSIRQGRASMCLGVYIASDGPLPLVAWNPAEPAFNVTGLSEVEAAVRAQFTGRNVVYAGSHTQCGCGFNATDDNDPLQVLKSRGALLAYLRSVARAGSLELFTCWEGDYSEAPTSRATRELDELETSDEWLDELAWTRIPMLAP